MIKRLKHLLALGRIRPRPNPVVPFDPENRRELRTPCRKVGAMDHSPVAHFTTRGPEDHWGLR
jgi:hypothetical protein